MIQIDLSFLISALLTKYFLVIYFSVIDIIKLYQPQKLTPIIIHVLNPALSWKPSKFICNGLQVASCFLHVITVEHVSVKLN